MAFNASDLLTVMSCIQEPSNKVLGVLQHGSRPEENTVFAEALCAQLVSVGLHFPC